MNWKSGKLGKHFVIRKTLKGNLLTKEKIKCRCGEIVNLGEYAEREIGHKLRLGVQNLEKKVETNEKMSRLNQKAKAGGIYMEELYRGYVKLTKNYDAEAEAPREFSKGADVFCPKCQLSLGRLEVTVALAEDLPEVSISKNDIIKLEAGPEMEAVASKRMGFASVEELRRWLDDKDMEKAKGILNNAVGELRELALDYDTSSIIGVIQTQIDEITIEAKRRKVALADAIEIIVREQTPIIK